MQKLEIPSGLAVWRLTPNSMSRKRALFRGSVVCIMFKVIFEIKPQNN